MAPFSDVPQALPTYPKSKPKNKGQFGKAYVGRHLDKETNKFVEVNKIERTLGPRCSCKVSYYLCKQVSDADREKIHNSIWSIAWDEKRSL